MIFIVLSRLISNSLTRHAILFADPLTEINELAALGAKRSERIIPPLDLFVAGGTLFHEPEFERPGFSSLVETRSPRAITTPDA